MMGIGGCFAAAQERSSRSPSLLPSPPASSQPMAFRATRSMAGRHGYFRRCICLGVAGGYTGMDCETQEVGSEGLPIIISQTSQVDCYECAVIRACLLDALLNLPAVGSHPISDACGQLCCLGKCAVWQAWSTQAPSKECIFHPHAARLSRFLNLVRTSGNQMSPKLFSEEVGATLAIGFGGKEDVDVSAFFKISFASEKSGLMVKHELTPSLKFDNMVKAQFLVNYRMPHKQILKFMKDDMILAANARGSSNAKKKTLAEVPSMQPLLSNKFVKSDCRNDKMMSMVPRVKQPPVSSKVDANGSLPHSTKAGIPLLRVHTACWPWLFLLVILLSASGVNPAVDRSAEQGNCRYDLTSVATFSCLNAKRVWQRPSKTCCMALLHAIDHIPPSGESGACCLCRYLRGKHQPLELATIYVLCKGKDRRAVAKWSSVTACSTVCKKRSNSSSDMGASAHKDNPVVPGTSNDIFKIVWVATAAAAVLMGLICFWIFWRFKFAVKVREQRHPKGGRRQSSARSSTQLKGRRIATSRSSPNS